MRAKKKRTAAQRIVALEKELARADALLKRGKDTMREHAGVLAQATEKIVDLEKKLVAAEKALEASQMLVKVHSEALERHVPELVELKRKLAAEKTSVEFWIYEASRWRKEAEDLRRKNAMDAVT